MPALAQLVSIAGPPLALPAPSGSLSEWGERGLELAELLRQRNGFYACLSALHVFPLGRTAGVMDLESWNAAELWRQEYGALSEGHLFFAEDIFGGQFCIKDQGISSFDPETGATTPIGGGIEEWAQRILVGHDLLCGTSLARRWQERHGALPPGKRLVPKTPFVLGGDFTLDNLYAGDSVEAMRLRGHLASQIQDLPDGARVSLKVTPGAV